MSDDQLVIEILTQVLDSTGRVLARFKKKGSPQNLMGIFLQPFASSLVHRKT
jgi:hypothetical protein